MIEYLKSIGIDVPFTIAGFAGGFTTLLRNKSLKWTEKFVVLVSGGLSANYISPMLADFINLSENSYLGVAFFVGYGGLKTVEKTFELIHKKLDNQNQKENE